MSKDTTIGEKIDTLITSAESSQAMLGVLARAFPSIAANTF